MTSAGSTVAVVGENNAFSNVRTRGSMPRASRASISWSSTPFARPRRSSSASTGSSDSSRATTSLPQRWTRRPFASQYARISSLPVRVKRAFKLSAV